MFNQLQYRLWKISLILSCAWWFMRVNEPQLSKLHPPGASGRSKGTLGISCLTSLSSDTVNSACICHLDYLRLNLAIVLLNSLDSLNWNVKCEYDSWFPYSPWQISWWVNIQNYSSQNVCLICVWIFHLSLIWRLFIFVFSKLSVSVHPSTAVIWANGIRRSMRILPSVRQSEVIKADLTLHP